MNIEQVKQDLENGIIVCKGTLVKLAEASVMMKQTLEQVANADRRTAQGHWAVLTLDKVQEIGEP